MTDTPKFKVGTEEFPFPDKFTLGDGVLVRLVTGGIDVEEIAEMLDRPKPPAVAMTAYFAVAVAHVHKDWSHAKVVQFVNEIDPETLDIEEAAVPPAEPPATAATEEESPSPDSSTDSTPSLEDMSGAPV